MIERAELTRLMTAAADGERRAIDPLYGALWPIAVSYAGRLLGDDSLAEDAAQNALVRLFGQVAHFDPARGDALTWALTLVTWECRTLRKRRARRNDTASAPDPVEDHRVVVEERDAIRSVLAALMTLSPADIDIITDPDALRAQLAPATFRKRLERAVARLRLSRLGLGGGRRGRRPGFSPRMSSGARRIRGRSRHGT